MNTALVALAENRPADALDELLELWRKAPSTSLAEPIDAIGRHLARSLPAIPTRRLHGHWMDLYAQAHPVDLPVLVTSAFGGKNKEARLRLEALLELPPDPRTTVPMLTWAEERANDEAFFTDSPLWTRLFRLAVHVGDARMKKGLQSLLERLKAEDLEEHYRYSEGRDLIGWLDGKLGKLQVTDTKVDVSALNPLVQALIEGPVLPIEAARPPRTSVKKEVRESIYDNVDDDGAISVWADMLTEQGDELGEFVTLQLRHERKPLTRKLQARVAKLQKTHISRLLGPLAGVVKPGTAKFRRGLLYACRVSLKTPEQRETLVHDPFWRSVRQIHTTTPHLRSDALEGVLRTGMRLVPHDLGGYAGPEGFRHLTGSAPGWPQFAALAKGPPRKITSVCAGLPKRVPTAKDVVFLDGMAGLPALDELHLVSANLGGGDFASRLGPLHRHATVRSVRRLIFDGFGGMNAVDLWRDYRTAGQELLMLGLASVEVWDDEGLRCTVTTGVQGKWGLPRLLAFLGAPDAFASITVRSPPWDRAEHEALAEGLKGCPELKLPKVRKG